jgi:hypothetical protein
MPTPEEWLTTLGKRLDERYWTLKKFDDYYRGDHKLQFASTKFREAFGSLFSEFSDNFCELVVDAVEERLNVEGFRLGDSQADKDAWDIWQRNNLDAESQIAHTEALVKRESSVIVWSENGQPVITVEDPMEVVVSYSAQNRRQRTAALKRWVGEDGMLYGTLYLPEGIYKFISKQKRDWFSYSQWNEYVKVEWERREVPSEAWPLRNPLGVVPVVPIVNRPRLMGHGESEIAAVIPLQDAINKLVSDMLLASEFGAFRQKWATNIELEVDPDTGQPKEPFKIAVDRILTAPPARAGEQETKFGEFSQTDLAPYVKAIDTMVQHMASITRTPQHYFIQNSGGQPPSGESIKSAETGLVSKARRKMRHFGESWEEVIRLGFAVLGDPRQNVTGAQTIWRDPESRTESELVDALVKMSTLGVPREALWEKWGASPQEIARWKAQMAEEALLAPEPVLLPVNNANAA